MNDGEDAAFVLFWFMDLLATLAMTIAMSATPADLEPGGPLCRANGRWYRQGEEACINLPCSEPHLARCDRVLNNPSWRRIGDVCPLTEKSPDEGPSLAGLDVFQMSMCPRG